MNDSQQALRKAAILIDSLDSRGADELLEQMGERQASLVRSAVMQLGEIAQHERDQVIAEFMGQKYPNPAGDAEDDVEIDASLAAKIAIGANHAATDAASTASAPSIAPAASPPFSWLKEADAISIAALLTSEHPQVAAVVVAHLAPKQAADVLSEMPAALQTDVLRRIVDLDETSLEVLQEIDHQLASQLSEKLHAKRRRTAGVAAVGTILASARDGNRSQILANLAGSDKELAGHVNRASNEFAADSPVARLRRNLAEVKAGRPLDEGAPSTEERMLSIEPTPQEQYGLPAATGEADPSTAEPEPPTDTIELSFDDLLQFDDRSLATVLGTARSDLALLALTGAPRRLIDRVLKQLSRREARALTQRMQQSGPLRLRDIEMAQQQLARIAGRLVSQGKIKPPAVRRFAVAA